MNHLSSDSPVRGAAETGEAPSAVARRQIGKSHLFKFGISNLVSVETSGVSLELIVVRIFDLWLFAAGILTFLCSQLVVVEVMNRKAKSYCLCSAVHGADTIV